MQFKSVRRQSKGFTLVEALVVLAIIALLAAIGMTAFDGSRTKAQTLLTVMSQTAAGAQQFKTDTGVMPQFPEALWNSAKAKAFSANGNTTGGRDVSSQWQRPYMAAQTTTGAASGNFLLDRVSPGVEISYWSQAAGGRTYWMVRATNVPSEIAESFLAECNADNGAARALSATTVSQSKCLGTPAVAGSTMYLVFDQSR